MQAGGVAVRDAVAVAQDAEHGAEVLEGGDAAVSVFFQEKGHGGAGLHQEDAVGLVQVDSQYFRDCFQRTAFVRCAVEHSGSLDYQLSGGQAGIGQQLLHCSGVYERILRRCPHGGLRAVQCHGSQ